MNKRVLVADDDSMLLQLLRLEFEQHNETVDLVTAENGMEAIQSIDATQPHVLVLDLRMPKTDGFAVLEHIQKLKYDFPVIVLTNYNKPEYRDKCTHFGVHEYIVKSEMRFSQIMGKLQKYVEA